MAFGIIRIHFEKRISLARWYPHFNRNQISRLNRKGITESGVRFGSESYSEEELIAEIGASFLAAKAGIAASTLNNSASYIANWLSVLKRDKRIVIFAAAQAQKAADYILGIHPSKSSNE